MPENVVVAKDSGVYMRENKQSWEINVKSSLGTMLLASPQADAASEPIVVASACTSNNNWIFAPFQTPSLQRLG